MFNAPLNVAKVVNGLIMVHRRRSMRRKRYDCGAIGDDLANNQKTAGEFRYLVFKHVLAVLFPVVAIAGFGNAQWTCAGEPVRFVPFHHVTMDDVIWRPRIRMLVRDTLPHAFTNTEAAQERLRLCGDWIESGGKTPKPQPHRFNTSDLYKVMEGAALMIQSEPNEEIEAMMDRIIDIIARAQTEDGYLYVPHITESIFVNEMGTRPYSYLIHSHELYNVGHLYEAAVAYAQATGKTKLLDVAEKSARHVQRVIFEGDPSYNDGKPVMQAPGHQEIEIGLVKLYQYTGNRVYLDMAKRFLDIRGVSFTPDGEGVNSPTYAQQHAPVAEQTKATGHAVRATYQYAAMAEVDSLLSTGDYSAALDSIWHNIVDTKMHITGGLGAVPGIEGFGPDYVLPNKRTYLETCAAVGNVFFNLRMFLKYRDAKYVDVAEIALLNNCLSGVGSDGKSFFYPNPLEADFDHAPRSVWFGTACCPSNIARLIPQVSGYMYAVDDGGIYCTLYGGNQATLTVGDTDVKLTQTTDYPWSGNIDLTLEPNQPKEFALRLRIPTWVGGQIVPGDLYRYQDSADQWYLEVNEEVVNPEMEKGFAVLKRKWTAGDRVTLKLAMPIEINQCAEQVAANRGRVCFSRGPLVLCAEGVDNGGTVRRFFVGDQWNAAGVSKRTIRSGPLAGLPEVTVEVNELDIETDLASKAKLKLIPYFAWSNRDRSSMQVWFPVSKDLVEPDYSLPSTFKFADVSASHTFHHDTVTAIRMRHTPSSSSDTSIRRWTSWPQRGREQWVEIELKQPEEVRSVGIYFYDDKGGVQVPKAWHLEVPDGDDWARLEIYNTDQYSTLKDAYNTVHPAEKLITKKLRIALTPQHDRTTVGILSVNVETE